jgi:hypothetical protein
MLQQHLFIMHAQRHHPEISTQLTQFDVSVTASRQTGNHTSSQEHLKNVQSPLSDEAEGSGEFVVLSLRCSSGSL